ncbi:hypothetical protein BTW10_02660 [Chromohalobacter japonicus]|uniref:Integrase n=1 Tax=Chromohalobacter japonicus TaxID=223900 RepID=A0A1Q8TFF4_9GAMM|nr:hypothetical protein [Chromohalobacter japonicus]OLO12392.1 hypothetical protein BTW10_02660 [Chromohalobacter japonicus]
MNNVIPFVPKERLAAKAALQEFINWAKSQVHLYDKPDDPVQWSAVSWHRWGLKQAVFFKLGGGELLHPEFIDFAKAIIFEERAVKLNADQLILQALRCLEAALIGISRQADVTAINAAVLDRACVIAQEYHSCEFSVYRVSRLLKHLADRLHAAGLVARPFIWEPQIKQSRMTLEDSEANAKKKLPSDAALIALGEIFYSRPELPLDIMVTSAVALMLSHPCRVGELKYVRKDCFFTERDNKGQEQLYILWHSEKGFGANRKPIIDSMAEVCKEAVLRVVDITQEPREYAKWLEKNPETFPFHAGVPNKGLDEPLSYQEACDALMISKKDHTPRLTLRAFMGKVSERKTIPERARKVAQEFLDNFHATRGAKHFLNGEGGEDELNEMQGITLRKLNILVRDKYLPQCFPYTDENRIIKWQDALFCFRTGTFRLSDFGVRKPFGLTGCDSGRLSAQLAKNQKKTKSIFERYGYQGVKVNTHAFRHYLNTGAHRANLSEELIARWSGRVDVSQNRVYNHMSVDEKTAEVENFAPQLPTVSGNLISSLKTNVPISMKDLGEESDRIVHCTEFGICIHDYAQEPCAKFNNCLTCGEHVCVKGDQTKLDNLREERGYLRSSLNSFQKEAGAGAYGANTWLQTTMEKLERCDQLIAVLENPDVHDGALIKGIENGWTVGRNASAIRGELVVENTGLIAADAEDDKVAELELLLGWRG